MHAIKSIAPVLGVVAFVGLSVLAFLLFQQARDIRRLREWAGRAPERAKEAADAVQAAAEASRDEAEAAGPSEAEGLVEEGEPPRRVGAAWARVKGAVGPRLAAIDRRLPVDGRYLLGIVAVLVIAAAVVTSGFGLIGGSTGGKHHKHGASDKPKVAVLNGTSVPNLASRVDHDVVEKAGYKSSEVTNSPSSFTQTVVMYASGSRADAKALATAIQPKLGQTPTGQMTADVQARAGGAPLALALGLDDATFGG
jgi:LytR cell envelope-related transcriptional attenuator